MMPARLADPLGRRPLLRLPALPFQPARAMAHSCGRDVAGRGAPPPRRFLPWGPVRHSPGACEQRLGIEDCENGLVRVPLLPSIQTSFRPSLTERLLRPPANTRRCCAPTSRGCYIATLKLHNGRLCGVEVWRSDGVSGLGAGWSVLRRDLVLAPGDVAVFARAAPADGKFLLARFYDADGNERLDRKLNPFGPAFPGSSNSKPFLSISSRPQRNERFNKLLMRLF